MLMMLLRQITYITYLTWGKTCVQFYFFFKSNVNCHLPVLIISRILIYINDSYDVLIWSDTQILCMYILNPRTIRIIIIKFQCCICFSTLPCCERKQRNILYINLRILYVGTKGVVHVWCFETSVKLWFCNGYNVFGVWIFIFPRINKIHIIRHLNFYTNVTECQITKGVYSNSFVPIRRYDFISFYLKC